jgi:acetyl-CoA C-acetyltransferase
VRPQGAIDCAADVYRQAGITDPLRQIDMAELYVPFSWYEPIWLEGHGIAEVGQGWRMVDSGETAIGGTFPVNASGGVLSSNPIGASGLLRFAEAALQVRGAAGEHQVDGAKVALAQAYGANMQYFAMWVVASSLHPF